MDSDGRVFTELRGVQARDGECLINYDGAVATTAHGETSPQEAIKAAGFGRFELVAYHPTEPLDSLVYYYENDGDQRVGQYTVNVMQDGSFIVHAVLASTPLAS